MKHIRLIARLDIKGPNLVKGIHLEGLRKLGPPNDAAKKYYEQGIDEIIYMDIVASLYERNSLLHIVEEATDDIFIPMTIGGGIRSTENVQEALRSGADKVAINSAAIKNPALITDIATRFGTQCTVVSVEAKQIAAGKWEAYYDNGREKTGRDVIQWVQEAIRLGAGEILLTSVDREGTAKGMDIELIQHVSKDLHVPLVVSGGIGNLDHIKTVVEQCRVDGIAMAHALHYDTLSIEEIRQYLEAL